MKRGGKECGKESFLFELVQRRCRQLLTMSQTFTFSWTFSTLCSMPMFSLNFYKGALKKKCFEAVAALASSKPTQE